MGDTISTYRARIGLFCGGNKNRHQKSGKQNNNLWAILNPLKISLCLKLILLSLVLLLLQCGDIESNPGPPKATRQTKLFNPGPGDSGRDDTDDPYTRLADLIESSSLSIREDILSLKQSIEEHKKDTSEQFSELKDEVSELRKENEDLKRSLARIDNQQRRKNLIFYDVPESNEEEPENSNDRISKIRQRLEDQEETESVTEIDSTRRLGKQDPQKTRPIMCTFMKQMDRDRILQKHKELKKNKTGDLKIAEDYPEDVRTRRKELNLLINPLKELHSEKKIYLIYDKLAIGSKRYTTKDLTMLKDHVNNDADLKNPIK